MAIADEIARVEREFISGEVLLHALMKQENLSALHTASWFLRNITQLDAIPMLTFNAELRDFEVLETPWASDVFHDLTVGGVFEDGPISWDDGNGNEGGWLSSDLRKFFSAVGVTYPQLEIENILQERASKTASIPKAAKVKTRKVDAFLASRGHDFLLLQEWLETLGNKSEISKVGLALRLAFEELGSFIPLYYLDSLSNATLPARITTSDAAATWSDLLVSFALDEMMPDCFFGDCPTAWRWCGNLYVKQSDCARFQQDSGLGSASVVGSGGELEKGVLDVNAARARDRALVTSQTEHAQAKQIVRAVSQAGERELATRERNTLLSIIAVLCKEAKLDYSKPAKTAGLIQGIADSMGVSIGETTIENHLKKIPDALGTRTR